MNLFLLDDPMKPAIHPMFGHVGTWSEATVCKTCRQSNQTLVEPLLIEWESGSRNIGDFSWCGYTTVVLDPVKDWMRENGFEVQFGRTQVVKPTSKTWRMPRVAFPYVGPQLNWLIAEKKLSLDEVASGIEPITDCPACGQKRTSFIRENIAVRKSNWHGEKIFEFEQNRNSGAMFVTEEAAKLLELSKFNNYELVLAGKIVA